MSAVTVSEVIPKSGLVFSEKGCLTYALCKPKVMAIKSVTLQKLEEMEKKAAGLGRVDVDEAAAWHARAREGAGRRGGDGNEAAAKEVEMAGR